MSQIAALWGGLGGESEGVSHFSLAMRDQNASPHQAVAAVARRQHGVVDPADLIAIGLSPAAIGRWSAQGQLHRVHRGVYAVGHAVLTELGRWLAAVKACGPGAVLSHISAAALWDLIRSSSPIIHVTTPNRASPKGIRVHRVRRLHPDDVALIDGVPVTSVARTLLDLADVLQGHRAGRAAGAHEDTARSHRRRHRRPAPHQLRRGDLLDFCDDHGLPRPELNVLVEGYEVDALWRMRKMVVELDSYAFHRSLRAFEQDRDKYADLQLAGYLVLPLTRLNEAAARRISAAVEAR
jgi:predicted transcriptional regulator of viral defense system